MVTRRRQQHKQHIYTPVGGGQEGAIDMIRNRVKEGTSNALQVVEDAGLKIAGLERIHTTPQENQLGQTASNVTAGFLNKINNVLGSPQTKETMQQAATNTAAITAALLQNFNNTINNNPVLKAQVKRALDHAGEISSMVIEAGKQPFNQFVDVAAQSATTATGAVASRAIGAIPVVGAVVNGIDAMSSMANAASRITQSAADAFVETKQNLDKQYAQILEKKNLITDRTTNSMNQFLEQKLQGNMPQIQGGTRHQSKHKRRIQKNLRTKRRRSSLLVSSSKPSIL